MLAPLPNRTLFKECYICRYVLIYIISQMYKMCVRVVHLVYFCFNCNTGKLVVCALKNYLLTYLLT